MADDNFRSYRSRDTAAPRSAGTSDPWQSDDPLAELARLIGQSEPTNGFGGGAGGGPAGSIDQPTGTDWAVDDRYDDQNQPAEENYDVNGRARYEAARHIDTAPSYRPAAATHADDYESQEPAGQLSARMSAPMSRRDGEAVREYPRNVAAPELPQRRSIQAQPEPPSRQLPAFLPRLREDYDQDDYQDDGRQDEADEHAYELEDYAEEAPAPRRRSGFVVVAAVLGIAVLGTAGAFAYRAMFGSSMLPSLPPIIKADNGPNKIVPNKPNPNTADRGDASKAGSAEKLVSREEQPVDMPAPATPAPRVVSTIPIFPDPNPGQAGVPNAAGAGVLGAGGAASVLPAAPPPPPPPQADAAPAAPASSIWPPAPAAAAPVPSSAPASAAPVLGTAPRKIHTVIIRSDQMGAAPAATAAPSVPPPAPLPPVRTSPPRVAAQPLPRSMPESHAPANAPLSIVPNEGGAPAAPPPRMRTALAQPPTASAPEVRAETAPSAGGGYAVQVTSQRSEADAEAEFRALRTKFPTQLGGHEPIVRRADLGAKGVFYRALVGPYASAEQAAAMCSSLKAAGGNCLVQKD